MANQTQTTNGTRCRTPATNFVEHENGYGLELEMPGVDRANIEINVQGRELEIDGEKTLAPSEWRPVERETGHCEHGVLYLTLPKSKAVLPKKIEIA